MRRWNLCLIISVIMMITLAGCTETNNKAEITSGADAKNATAEAHKDKASAEESYAGEEQAEPTNIAGHPPVDEFNKWLEERAR